MARRDKKVFLRDQCKEIEENNRMGKTRNHFKKIRDTKGPFQAKMDTIQFSRSVMSDSLQPMNCRTPGLPVHHQLMESTQTYVH